MNAVVDLEDHIRTNLRVAELEARCSALENHIANQNIRELQEKLKEVREENERRENPQPQDVPRGEADPDDMDPDDADGPVYG
ncbi:hypothetical protein [uncultured Rhodospira sp.]|uniref:hypothetical protein n=1 Tax=uncultured Rhodospira sp. TaxID=1936189 RepID=UPI0026323A27|nr:hypothetical protein [uncultured Rhodospira sp.]